MKNASMFMIYLPQTFKLFGFTYFKL